MVDGSIRAGLAAGMGILAHNDRSISSHLRPGSHRDKQLGIRLCFGFLLQPPNSCAEICSQEKAMGLCFLSCRHHGSMDARSAMHHSEFLPADCWT